MNRKFGIQPRTKGKTPDKRVFSPGGQARRLAALKHNQLNGYVHLTQRNMYSIGMSDTTTVDAKRIAAEIYKLCEQLKLELKTRIDP